MITKEFQAAEEAMLSIRKETPLDSFKAEFKQTQTWHVLELVGPRILRACFNPVDENVVFVRTFNWRFEDEVAHFFPASVARRFYRKLKRLGFQIPVEEPNWMP